jgi:hypothetical protein
LIIILTLIIFAVPGCGESVPKATIEVEWEKTLPGSGNESGLFAQMTADGGYVIVSDTNCHYFSSALPRPVVAHCDIRVTKTDGSGSMEWDEIKPQWWPLLSVQQSPDGGYLFTTEDRNIRTDSTGKEVWERAIGYDIDSQTDNPFRQTSDGGYISSVGSTLTKTDASWNQEWQRTFDTFREFGGISVQQTSDGGYILAGTTSCHESDRDGVSVVDFCDMQLTRTDSNGNTVWDTVWKNESGQVRSYSAQQTSDEGYLLVCPQSPAGVRLMKADPFGKRQWDRTFGSPGPGYTYSVRETTDGGYVIAGLTSSSSGLGSYEVRLLKIDGSGNAKWDATSGGSGRVLSLLPTLDDGYVTVGSALDSTTSRWGIWLMKLECNPP